MKRVWALLGPFLGLFLVTMLFGMLRPEGFLSTGNFLTIAIQTVIVALCAIGMTFVIVGGGIDLSVGSVVALASVTCAVLAKAGLPIALAAPCGILAGALVGLGNGVLVTRLGLMPFIVTLGTMGIARGLAKHFAQEQPVNADPGFLPELVTRFPRPAWLVLAPSVWLLLLLALLLGFVLRRTVFGVHVYAIGSNEQNAALCGVRVQRTKLWVYVLSGALAGLAGILHFARVEVGDPTAASGLELQAVAAVVIGGGSLAGGEGTVLGSVLGAFLMAVLENGCTQVGLHTYVQEILIGAIIIVAVALDRWRQRRTG